MAINEGLAKTDGSAVPTDPNVRIPDSVRHAGATAEEIHARHYPRLPDGAAPAPGKDALPQPAQQLENPHTPQDQAHQGVPSADEQAAAAEAARAAQVEQQQQHPAATGADANVTAEEWRHRFLSMQGRFNAKVREVGGMEETMRQLGDELVRTQGLLSQVQGGAQQHAQNQGQAQNQPDHGNLITDADREAYGDELIDLAQRAARGAMTPELERLRADNAALTQRVQSTGKRELFSTLDQQQPNWRQINTSLQFKAWLRLPNVYTGQLRGNMLKAAVDGAEAPKVLALFRDFLAEAQATGQQFTAAQNEQQDQQRPAPREPALDLQTLAAPGRARPASGDGQVPVEKPTFTRAQIAKFYDDSRKGLYAGREAEYRQTEADMQQAQRDGRIR